MGSRAVIVGTEGEYRGNVFVVTRPARMFPTVIAAEVLAAEQATRIADFQAPAAHEDEVDPTEHLPSRVTIRPSVDLSNRDGSPQGRRYLTNRTRAARDSANA